MKTKKRRLTLELGPRASNALDGLCASSGLSKTQAVQNALSLYNFLLEEESRGSKPFLRNTEKDIERQIVLL